MPCYRSVRDYRSLVLSAFFLPVLIPALCMKGQAANKPKSLDLQTIMSSTDWIGHPVASPYWSADGKSILYWLKRDGSSANDTYQHVVGPGAKASDLYRVSVADGKTTKLSPTDQLTADGPLVTSRDRSHIAYLRHGDVFVFDSAKGQRTQVTATHDPKTSLRFSADGLSLQYVSQKTWYSYSLATGVSVPIAILNEGADPEALQAGALPELQMRLYSTLRQIRADKDTVRKQELEQLAVDPGMTPKPIWLGKKIRLLGADPSPDMKWMIAVTEPDTDAGPIGEMTKYVTESGYPQQVNGHRYPDEKKPQDQTILLIDLKSHQTFALSTGSLTGIHEDPLGDLRANRIAELENLGQHERALALAAPAKRSVRVIVGGSDGGGGGIDWSEDGSQVAIEMESVDCKDRWIATVDFSTHQLVPQHRLHDPAWISWDNNEFGWLRDSRTIWFISEESGFAHLYTKAIDGPVTPLTSGTFEVGLPKLSPDGKWLYVKSNKTAPYDYDLYRVASGGGTLEKISELGSIDDYDFAPDGSKVFIVRSGPYVMRQLGVQSANGGQYLKLTDTMKPGFTALPWIEPQIVQVPSSHGAGMIYAKYYGPPKGAKGPTHPAVIFIHGAGYLQNVSKSWPYYYREQLFNNYLVQKGYVVLDMDYRASRGYGRKWRVGVYRQMGKQELEDLLDGKQWLIKNHGADRERVGLYGGSYGGFMTEYALLRAPGEFAAGAALRAPSDWADYNNEFSTDMMNTLELDPQAYKDSSPIEYAANLKDALLMSHGLLDDNVLASDSIRLYQRLIELHKTNFWLTLYPFDNHGFEFDADWYDEYRRIDELFDQFLKNAPLNKPTH